MHTCLIKIRPNQSQFCSVYIYEYIYKSWITDGKRINLREQHLKQITVML